MNNNYKYLIWSGTAVMVILAIFLLASTDKIINTAATTNTVSFSGEGKVTAKPDIAVISASIVTEAATSKAAQDDNSKKSNQITDFLEKQDIEDKDIKTTGYNIYPQYNYRTPKPQITGYQVTQSLEIKVRNLDNVSAVLDGLVTAGANQVSNLGLQVDNPEKLKDEARAKAIEDAKDKADVLKKQVGIKLGKIVGFSENTGGYPVPMYELKGMGMGGGDASSVPSIPTGENEIVINVMITYQIK